jgi:hypothetical protein
LNLILNAPNANAPNVLMDLAEKHPGIMHVALLCPDINLSRVPPLSSSWSYRHAIEPGVDRYCVGGSLARRSFPIFNWIGTKNMTKFGLGCVENSRIPVVFPTTQVLRNQ